MDQASIHTTKNQLFFPTTQNNQRKHQSSVLTMEIQPAGSSILPRTLLSSSLQHAAGPSGGLENALQNLLPTSFMEQLGIPLSQSGQKLEPQSPACGLLLGSAQWCRPGSCRCSSKQWFYVFSHLKLFWHPSMLSTPFQVSLDFFGRVRGPRHQASAASGSSSQVPQSRWRSGRSPACRHPHPVRFLPWAHLLWPNRIKLSWFGLWVRVRLGLRYADMIYHMKNIPYHT